MQMCGVVQSNNLTGRSHNFLSAHISDVLPIKTKALGGREGGKNRAERKLQASHCGFPPEQGWAGL